MTGCVCRNYHLKFFGFSNFIIPYLKFHRQIKKAGLFFRAKGIMMRIEFSFYCHSREGGNPVCLQLILDSLPTGRQAAGIYPRKNGGGNDT
jgi:hypothetical protein